MRRLIRACVLALLVLSIATLHSQELGQARPTTERRPIEIDRSGGPDSIPEDRAASLFLTALSEAQARKSPVFKEMVSRIGLNKQDRKVLESRLSQLHRTVSLLNGQAEEVNREADGSPTRREDFRELMIAREALITAAREDLSASLSPKGDAKLKAHIRDQRRNMRAIARPATP